MILRGPWDWQDDVEYEVSATGSCPRKSILDGISRYRCGCLEGPCEEALALYRQNINGYYLNIINRGQITARDYISPSDIWPRGGIFLPEAFGKAAPEASAALLIHYFQHLGVWTAFRPNEYAGWLRERMQKKDIKPVDDILSNPIFGPAGVQGLWGLMDKNVVVPVVKLREGEDVRNRLVHVTEEFILRCRLSTVGIKPKYWPLCAVIGQYLAPMGAA